MLFRSVDIQKDTSLDKIAEVLQPGAASASFEKDLASTILPMGEASKDKDKDKEIPPETTDKASKSKLHIKLKP